MSTFDAYGASVCGRCRLDVWGGNTQDVQGQLYHLPGQCPTSAADLPWAAAQ